MGDRYYLRVRCDCGHIEEDVYYAPTCGFMVFKCPKCQKRINLEKYSGINAESCALTEYGVEAVRRLKTEIKEEN